MNIAACHRHSFWTRTPPSEPGFYWVRNTRSPLYRPRVVEVFRRSPDAPLYVACPQAELTEGPLRSWLGIPGTQWARVPEPADPTNDL